jgi:hypothetical protein
MNIKDHTQSNSRIAIIESDHIVIQSASDALDLLGDVYYQGYQHLIIEEQHLTENFFDLQNGMAGEILQKFSNYRMGLAIVGDFQKYDKKSIKDFIRESNRTGQINFSNSIEEAIERFNL